MPRSLPWFELAVGLSEAEADMLLESFKAFHVSKSDLVPCSVCTDSAPHNMMMRTRLCACKQCSLAMPYARCKWRYKQLTCEREHVVDLFQLDKHAATTRRDQRPPRLTKPMKTNARELVDQWLKFELSSSSLPPLKTVQRFVNNYKAAQLGGSDYVDDLRRMERESGFTGHEGEFKAFTFTWRTDCEG
jgi:hypothetical protein